MEEYWRDPQAKRETKTFKRKRGSVRLPPTPAFHLDMDSFFATAEQQARPSLRGRPVGIGLADSPGTTLIATSREAKQLGIGTGTRLGDAKLLAPDITVLHSNPSRYRMIHRAVRDIIDGYCQVLRPRSIDEMAFWPRPLELSHRTPEELAAEIKQRIRDEVGEYLSSSVGVAPNWFLAKTACSYGKPDGLFHITEDNVRDVMGKLELQDLCGIAHRMAARFTLHGFPTPLSLYDADPVDLKRRFGVVGYFWYLRLHGGTVDTQDTSTKSFGHSSVIPKPVRDPALLRPLLQKLCAKLGRRMRREGYKGQVVSLYGSQMNYSGSWERSRRIAATQDEYDLFRHAWQLMRESPPTAPLRKLVVTMVDLVPTDPEQLSLFTPPRREVLAALDRVNDRWGEYTVRPASMMGSEAQANDSIAFGGGMAKEWQKMQ